MANTEKVRLNKYLSQAGICCVTDIFAYFTGMLFGRHKLPDRRGKSVCEWQDCRSGYAGQRSGQNYS